MQSYGKNLIKANKTTKTKAKNDVFGNFWGYGGGVTGEGLRVTGYGLWVMGYGLWVRGYGLGVTGYGGWEPVEKKCREMLHK